MHSPTYVARELIAQKTQRDQNPSVWLPEGNDYYQIYIYVVIGAYEYVSWKWITRKKNI